MAIYAVIAKRQQDRVERLAHLEDQLHEDRVTIYEKILEPFIILLMTDEAWEADSRNKGRKKNDVASRTLLSLDYKRTAFKLTLIGSDEVVRGFDELMQFFFSLGADSDGASPDKAADMLELLGTFLLEIRRSLGNEETGLETINMFEWLIKDARTRRPSSAQISAGSRSAKSMLPSIRRSKTP